MNESRIQQAAGEGRAATLRRLDWRFLLPTAQGERFRHLLLLGGPSGLAERILAAKLAERVSCDVVAGTRADAAILLYDSPLTREQAAPALAEGGILYQEIARRPFSSLTTTPARIKQQLQASGLTLTGLYWAAPNFDQCRRYIPIDFAGALEWYFSSLFVAGTPMHQLLRSLFRLVVDKKNNRLSRFMPNVCLTAVVGHVSNDLPALLSQLQIAEKLPKERLRPLLLTSGQDDASRLIMLPFAPHSSQKDQVPVAVIKIATGPTFNNETEVEQTVLQEVHKLLDTKTRQSVPQPLGNFRYGELAVAIESCAPGASVWSSSGAWGASSRQKIADLELGVAWLTDFHRQTESGRLRWDQQAIGRWIDMPLAAYAKVHQVTVAETRLFEAMRSYASTLIGAELPLVWQHNDFAPWNLFRKGDQLTVIDWEFNRNWKSTRAGPPLCDLLYFVTYWNNIANRLYSSKAELAGLAELFLEAAPRKATTQAARKAIGGYMAALKIDMRFLPLLLVYTWAERVVYSNSRSQKLAAEGNKSRAACNYANYIDLFAGQPERLFGEHEIGFWQGFAGVEEMSPVNASPVELSQ